MPKIVTLDEIRSWPATVDLPTAAAAIGVSRSHAYELANRDEFPCRVLKVGGRYRVVTSSLVALLDDAPAREIA
ncbi:helix-turn-helix domain-containing protein [Amycolatopsis cynarae]|uniref:Helix-turn-helix domain-containing protein n=1 Tax=Amycolatopsis cynarae TaxID=2995223 RepID=A0ABY7B5H9_9PSEU|nr:helix-turn-helix domain-containing protein [Amycolatopsis sp. HUAS 11-8]WAL67212.1 helix-turn-helix domain-containing protein [Amycolatopsis sp. HUAS 11-8]